MDERRFKMKPYTFRQWQIPEYMMYGILHYVQDGVPPGDFLKAIICNDLKEAVGRADDNNINNLPAYVAYFYNKAPSGCWGSKKKMDSWIKIIREAREEDAKEG